MQFSMILNLKSFKKEHKENILKRNKINNQFNFHKEKEGYSRSSRFPLLSSSAAVLLTCRV